MKANTGKVINISTTPHGNHYHHHPVSVLHPSVGRRTVHPAGHRRGRHRRNLLSGGCQLLHLRLVRAYHRTLVIRRVTRSLHPRRLLDATFQDTGKIFVAQVHRLQPGDEGVAVTRLALIGNADIGGRLVEVKSADGFLDEGTPVIVVRVEDAQITVKKK